ncbi:hypothetical protein JCM10908_004982 [Rhodotorula pacifica]|uniref:uncharacterized protein n=1 Tax=Rhodotorula pacifica TaxID=1495444 RepID=UPI00317CDDDD
MPSPLLSVPEDSALGSAAHERFDTISPPPVSPARSHSRIHSRNLSVFFPRPGTTSDKDATTDGSYVGSLASSSDNAAIDVTSGMIAQSTSERHATRTAQRRGHHHRHSVSIAVPASEARNRASDLDRSSTAGRNGESRAVPQLSERAGREASAPAQRASRPLAVLFAAAQLVLGAYLWVEGQRLESLSTTGIGYVVVFDGVAMILSGSAGISDASASAGMMRDLAGGGSAAATESLRRPYGKGRYRVLSHFAESIYLLFSAIYISKESIEHVLLLSDAQDSTGPHVHGHGASGHSGALAAPEQDMVLGLPVPAAALVTSALVALALAVFARNHVDLAHASRGSTQQRSERTSRNVRPKYVLPTRFTLILVGMVAALLCAASVLPRLSFASFDKMFALLESAVILSIAQPAAAASARTLLQTMPPRARSCDQAIALPGLPVEKAQMAHAWLVDRAEPGGAGAVAVANVTLHSAATDAQLMQASALLRETALRQLSDMPVHELRVDVQRIG